MKFRHYELTKLSDEALVKLRDSLEKWRDPVSQGLFRMVSAEVTLRKRQFPVIYLRGGARKEPKGFGKSCQKEAQSWVNAEKEPAMKNIWYAVKDNDVRFANNQNSLTSQGFTNPQSFTVQGDVNGLSLIDDNTGENNIGGATSAQQTA